MCGLPVPELYTALACGFHSGTMAGSGPFSCWYIAYCAGGTFPSPCRFERFKMKRTATPIAPKTAIPPTVAPAIIPALLLERPPDGGGVEVAVAGAVDVDAMFAGFTDSALDVADVEVTGPTVAGGLSTNKEMAVLMLLDDASAEIPQ